MSDTLSDAIELCAAMGVMLQRVGDEYQVSTTYHADSIEDALRQAEEMTRPRLLELGRKIVDES
jgi:type IV secretory pathway ATPase VirB11/archaellum biosynthesis ATPase